MSKRRELRDHSDSLTDIGELLGAMKNLALVESRRIATFIDAQRAAAQIIESTLADFTADYAEYITPAGSGGEVVCIIGSERGFCGDLNQRLISAAEDVVAPKAPDSNAALGTGLRRDDGEARHSGAGGNPETTAEVWASAETGEQCSQGDETAPRIVLVGSRLADAWSGEVAASISGAGFADEVPNILAELIATLAGVMDAGAGRVTPTLGLLYFTDAGPIRHSILPVRSPTSGGTGHSHPLQLNLPPRQFHAALIDQFLETALAGALYDALLEENRLRLEHMEHARRRIDQQCDDLARRINRARQEEITEEIEIIMLSSIATDGG